ncbi:MAG: NAD(P)H-hydrate epimerase [Phycisphaerae bacterium]|nr:NAD(P)H-hydrate epimerase [Phycisphaerae bacterium]
MDTKLTRQQIRRVDGIAIDELGIPGVVLMENAGRGAAEIIRELGKQRGANRVVVFCGRGNNGGDGFVIARHLLNAGLTVKVYLTVPGSELRGDARINHRILRNMGVAVSLIDNPEQMSTAASSLTSQDLVVDALLGTGFTGEVRQPLARLVDAINSAPKAATVAVDMPSGLDCDTGQPGGVAVRADLTVTFVAEKVGLSQPHARQWAGEVRVVGIGTPPSLISRV